MDSARRLTSTLACHYCCFMRAKQSELVVDTPTGPVTVTVPGWLRVVKLGDAVRVRRLRVA